MSLSWVPRPEGPHLPAAGAAPAEPPSRERGRLIALAAGRAELWALLALTATLNLWNLSRNRWANVYYSAAVRSMASSWHDFLYASMDKGGVMTVDKPPLALWVQALSVRVFGYHPLSILVPQALMGVASVALLYDLVRRRFGRPAGALAGLALAITPMTVAISRHNNPDALLVLCSVAALWCTVRGLERGATRWIVAAGACVGLGFETKMGVALVVVPGIVAAWLWIAPAARGRLHALGQLLRGGALMLLLGGAWPLLVELTPASDRPWISGTSDNRILSLIFEYNGLGRVDGQAGGPGGVGGRGGPFGGSTGPFRLLNEALGGQVAWLLGFAVVMALALALATRLRRGEPRSGWLIAVGGAFLTSGVLFSFASGIFHPYYVSLLAPFLAAFVGAGAGTLLRARGRGPLAGPLALLAGVAIELVVLSDYPGQLSWLVPVLVAVGVLAAIALAVSLSSRLRLLALCCGLGVLLIAPAAWAVDTLGYATSSTFPAGGPQSVSAQSGVGAGRGGGPAFGSGTPQLFGSPGSAGQAPGGAGAPGGGSFGGGVPGGSFGAGGGSFKSALAYAASHGGGTLAVSSQSTAAQAIVEDDANVAGIGGFSGRESEVSVRWLAQQVRDGKIRWVLDEEGSGSGSFGARASGSAGLGGQAPGLFGAGGSSAASGGQGTGAEPAATAGAEGPGGPGSTGGGATGLEGSRAGAFGPPLGGFGGRPGESRLGSRPAMEAVAKACKRVSLEGSETGGSLYDCAGRAAALEATARKA